MNNTQLQREDIEYFINIQEAQTFKNLHHILKQINNVEDIILTEKEITIVCTYTDLKYIYYISLNKDVLDEYYYNKYDEDGNIVHYRLNNINPADVVTSLKNIAKTNGVRIFNIKNSYKITLQDDNNNNMLFNNGSYISITTIADRNPFFYDFEKNYENVPFVKIKAKDFSDLCTRASSGKCKYLDILDYNPKLRFIAYKNDETVQFDEYSNNKIIYDENNPILNEIDKILNEDSAAGRIRLNLDNIKALSKIHNLGNKNSYMKIYFCHNYDNIKPMIERKLGIEQYGYFRILIC